MKLFRPLGFGVLALTAVLLTSCGSTETGTATTPAGNPEDTDTTQTSPDNSPGLAPPVPEPLDPEMLLSEPCDLLTDTQLDQLGLVEYSSRIDSLGDHECTWAESEEGTRKISISAMGNNENGLSDIYAQREQYNHFEPTTINGYPAVIADPYTLLEDGACPLYVGITDQLTAYTIAQFPIASDDDPCPITQDVAEAMIDTLQD